MSEKRPSTKQFKAKGSILLEILAVILAAALVFSVTYPNKLWKAEDKNLEKCRENMWHIYFAEVTYLDANLVYNDTLEKVIDFIVSDTTGKRLKRYTSLDSILGGQIIKTFKTLDDKVTITVDSVFGAGPDSVITKMVDIQVSALVDSMLDYANEVDLDTTEAFVLDSLRFWPAYAAKIDTIAFVTLDGLYTCPTVGRDYIISANNDTIPKLINISCPIDSTDKEELAADFKRSFLGGLRIENHGALDNGEKTW
ncbi:hypothetical protein JXA02_09875 [candidate division KSB1 bacterium]|nr:hypothetical protein [candidate division KSB1 bacterium]RQW04044.1 MAG: hypothetical protein EH222_11725 [candidate division KSB1 bacterium]